MPKPLIYHLRGAIRSVTEPVAVIDCGSNSTRLLVDDGAGVALARDMRITRLSAGVDASRRLSLDAIERTMRVLDEYRVTANHLGARRGVVVATSAVRDATNRDEFTERARRHTGFDVRVLDGDEEAALSYDGATADLADDERATVIVDVGGGSTELAARLAGVLHAASMQLGCVRVSERALGTGVVGVAERNAAQAMIDLALDEVVARDPVWSTLTGRVRLIGLAGTVATLVQLDVGLAAYDRSVVHHHRVTRTAVQTWRDRLARETPDQRLAHPGMVVGREDVLVGGLMILDAVMGRLGAVDLLSSESDILDGVAASFRR